MRILEKVLIVLMLAAIVMRFLMLPFSLVLFVLSAMGLSTLYFSMSTFLINHVRLRDLTKRSTFSDIRSKELVLGALVGLSLAVIIVGILFKWMAWPNGNVQLLVGCISAIIITIVSLLIAKKSFNLSLVSRVIPCVLLGLILYSFSTYQISKWVMNDYPEIVKAYENLEKDPLNTEFKLEMRELELKLRFDDAHVEEIMKEERLKMLEQNSN